VCFVVSLPNLSKVGSKALESYLMDNCEHMITDIMNATGGGEFAVMAPKHRPFVSKAIVGVVEHFRLRSVVDARMLLHFCLLWRYYFDNIVVKKADASPNKHKQTASRWVKQECIPPVVELCSKGMAAEERAKTEKELCQEFENYFSAGNRWMADLSLVEPPTIDAAFTYWSGVITSFAGLKSLGWMMKSMTVEFKEALERLCPTPAARRKELLRLWSGEIGLTAFVQQVVNRARPLALLTAASSSSGAAAGMPRIAGDGGAAAARLSDAEVNSASSVLLRTEVRRMGVQIDRMSVHTSAALRGGAAAKALLINADSPDEISGSEDDEAAAAPRAKPKSAAAVVPSLYPPGTVQPSTARKQTSGAKRAETILSSLTTQLQPSERATLTEERGVAVRQQREALRQLFQVPTDQALLDRMKWTADQRHVNYVDLVGLMMRLSTFRRGFDHCGDRVTIFGGGACEEPSSLLQLPRLHDLLTNHHVQMLHSLVISPPARPLAPHARRLASRIDVPAA